MEVQIKKPPTGRLIKLYTGTFFQIKRNKHSFEKQKKVV